MINEADILCRNLCQLWQDGGIALKEGLQNILFPSGLVYDKKNGAFRTPELNEIIAEIARVSGDFAIIKKGLSSLYKTKPLCAVRAGFKSTWLTPVRQAREKIIHQKHLQSLVVTQNKKSPVKDFSAVRAGFESTWLTPVRQARVKIIHQKHLQSLVVTQNKKSPVKDFSAVRAGFEPAVRLPVRQFSKLFLSASQAPHLF